MAERKEIDMVEAMCVEYGVDTRIMIQRLNIIKKQLPGYSLLKFNYGQRCGGNYCFYGIFGMNNGWVARDFDDEFDDEFDACDDEEASGTGCDV